MELPHGDVPGRRVCNTFVHVQATGDESAEHLRRVARGEEDYFAAYEKLQEATEVDLAEELVETGEKASSLEETDATKVNLGEKLDKGNSTKS
jgi:hypothetical protein